MSTALVWFRHDLRLADNPALRAATAAADHVVPVYVWSPEDEGAWAPGAASRWWLHESLRALDASLRERGSQLILARGPTIEALLDLAAGTGATQLYWNRRYEPAAIAVERALERRLKSDGLIGHGFHSSRLAAPDAVRSGSGTPYQVFTPYCRAFLEQVQIDAPEASPRTLTAPKNSPRSLSLDALQLLPRIPWHLTLAEHWQPGEAAARKVLRRFVEQQLPQYAQQRDQPDLTTTSQLSPYLHHGELSARQVWTAVLKAGERQGMKPQAVRTGKFCAELIWREFATQQLVLHPSLPDRPRSPQFERLPWRDDAREFRAWTQGRTGIPIVDAGMRELWHTGWMHNRVRMITASFLVKNLLQDWRTGERWFWDTLVDADLASNALNWQWVAGTSPDAAPWFRIFNPHTQAEKFDPDGIYQRRHVPEAATPGYSAPIVDLKQSRQRALDAFAGLRSPP
ncbi:MAG TPA: deoxyribodipyrimidine photo-lyase [Steroidobacteraceae bacterium]|nr:deoxyribodipyrimidine photo-lyase [Steroidobacteraceae bacterium]